MEILSPSNENATWTNIWSYTTIPSISEILVIRSTRIEAELLRRQADGHWPNDPALVGPDGVLALDSIGFQAPLATLYETTSLRR